MTIKEAIDAIDAIKPNAFDNATKTRWLQHCEGRVQTEILLHDYVEVLRYSWPEDKDAELLVEPPYDGIYPAYLAAMIDLANGEYEKYANSMTVYNSELRAFERWFSAKYRPADRPGIYDYD